MADKKISALTAATTPLAGTEVLPIVQSGTTVKVAVSDLTAGRTVNATTFDTGVTTAKATLSGTTLAAAGSNTNVSLRIDPKGTGGVGVGIAPVNKVQILQASTASPPAAGASGHTFALGDSGFGLASGALSSGNAYLQATRWDGVAANYNLSLQPNGGDVLMGANLIPSTAAKGINFTANTPQSGMTSQLLNWYEEGTWTPTFTTDGTAFSTLTFTVQNGRYTRVGRMVYCEFNIRINAVSGGTGNLYLSGLPFTSAATFNDTGGMVGLSLNWASNAVAPTNLGVQANSTNAALYKDAYGSTCTAASPTGGCYFRGSVCYVAA